MMLPALDQKLPSFHVLIPQVITVYIARMLVLSVFHVSVLMMNYINLAFTLVKQRPQVIDGILGPRFI